MMMTEISSTESLEISLRNQAFHITLPDVELAVFRQRDGPVISVSTLFMCPND